MAQGERHPFSADRPIEGISADKLGRGPFSTAIAEAIAGWRQRDSLVIALYGAWGSGKSSIKNMVLDLVSKKAEGPIVIEFNPWEWAAQDQLARAFFEEISSALDCKTETTKDLKHLAAQLRLYAARLRLGGHLASGFRGLLIFVLSVAAVVGFVAPSYRIVGYLLAGLCALGAAAVGWSEGLFDRLAGLAEAREAARNQKLSAFKHNLSASLARLKAPLLILIDDVDRLTAEQIRLLFQLVKANADFPNVVYLLLFQRDIIETSLSENVPKAAPSYGKEYLEKIIQVGFDVPRLAQDKLERFLFDGINQALGLEGVGKRFDNDRWWTIFPSGLRPYFGTMRDVNRFLGSFLFHVSLFRNRGSFEVNPVDLIAIEVLRVYEPEVYHRLFQIKETLTSLRTGILDRDQKSIEAAKATVTAAVQLGTLANHGILLKLLKELFPQIEGLFGGPNYSQESLDRWYRGMRVAHPDVFDRYFYFAVPENDISAAELEELLGKAGDREAFRSTLLEFRKRGMLGLLMERLEAYKEKIELAYAVPFITALFDVGDSLPKDRVGMFDMGADMHASRIIYWYLRQAPDSATRACILHDAITSTTGVYLPIMKVSLESDKKKRSERPDLFALTEQDVARLQADCLRNLRRAVDDGSLKDNPHLQYIIYHWKEWAGEQEPKDWVSRLVATDEGLLTLLTANLQQSQSVSSSGGVVKTRWAIQLKVLEEFTRVDGFADRLTAIPKDRLNDKQILAVDAFFKALDRRARGKENSSWPSDDE